MSYYNLKIQYRKKKYYIIKMETSQIFQGLSICSELNLKIQDLNIQKLLQNPIYRRLYNIVLHDTNKTQYDYRKNLIKQLYFLLKITPIMKPQLQNSYLQKLQKWYNSNDHKKTELGSGRLRNLMQQYSSNKQSSTQKSNIRPQSGINWNKNINPFLRPYTAKRPNNFQNRPQSYKSKFGQSTKAQTQLQSFNQIRDFALSIREQFQVSQDFINKNRTIHPQSEPIYEQLFSIIKKAGISFKTNLRQEDNQNEYLFQRDKQEFLNQSQNDLNLSNNKQIQKKQNSNSIIQDAQDFDKVSQQSQKEQEQQKQQEQENVFQRKIYTRDQNISRQKQTPVQGFLYLQNQNQNDTLLLKKANNKYLHITNNKFINYSKDDHEMVRNYVNYTRIKSAMRKQLNRKSQSKRLLSAKLRSNTNISLNPKSQIKNPRIYSALPKRNQNSLARNSDKSEIFNANSAKIFDFSELGSQKQNNLVFKNSRSYNQRNQLDKIYRKPIQQYKKLNKNNIAVAQIKSKQKKLLTKYDCFLTRQKINPIADIHIQQHNQQALEQIQKIKQKVAGLGKKSISTDSLMKALYIDSYDKIGSCQSINKTLNLVSSPSDQNLNIKKQEFNWQKRNIYFNMLSNGQKKMKKKTRKQIKQIKPK